MAEMYAPGLDLSIIPDDLTIPQFFLDETHPLRPVSTTNTPWLIEDETGREIGYEEVRATPEPRHRELIP